MSLALNGSSVIWHFKCSDAIKIHWGDLWFIDCSSSVLGKVFIMTIFTMSSQLPSNMPHSKINIKRFCSAGFSASLQSAESFLVSTHLRKPSRVTKSQHNSPTYYFSVQNNSTVPKCVSKLQSDGWVRVLLGQRSICAWCYILTNIDRVLQLKYLSQPEEPLP